LSESTELINDLVSENTIMGNFITFFWGLLKDEEREITYVNAGHNPPLLIRGGKVNYLKKGGMILGLMKTMIPYESESLTLEPGDALILFTDGITEAMNKNKEEFSDERLEKLAVNSADKSAKDILEMIRREVVKHVNGAEQSDDITLMVIKSL
ncbi:MAG TPA: PP2C family protein-serine/threonine phosphatase, partial [Ignavibacteriales bacterium]|nr:PP2C family protein-serine/threonine phosphatase [Ignavibacteriales bacterium]